MKSFNVVILMVVVLLVASCAAIKPLELHSQAVDSGEVNNTINTVNLSDIERLQITHAMNAFSEFVAKWNGFGDTLDPQKLQEFNDDFTGIANQYEQVQKIVETHWQEYPADMKDKLLRYREEARLYKQMANGLYKTKQWLDFASKTRDYAAIAITIAQTIKP